MGRGSNTDAAGASGDGKGKVEFFHHEGHEGREEILDRITGSTELK